MYLTTKGLVLRITNYNDTDALLTVLTHTHGKLTLKARGLRRKNSPITAPCQLLAYGEFVLFEYRDMYTINEARAIELFQGLRKDIQRLSLGSYFAQVAEVLCQEDSPNPELLSLTLNSLYVLSNINMDERQIRATFELRSACIGGYAPNLNGCVQCGSLDCVQFDLRGGQLECGRCRNFASDGLRIPIWHSTLDAMRYICTCEPKKVFSYELGSEALDQLVQITELYLMTQLERGFATLDFYKSLFLIP